MKVYTADEIRLVEEKENEIGTRFIRLMENAGAACAKHISRDIEFDLKKAGVPYANREDIKVCVVCGKGKNGGDGFVIARKLAAEGYTVCAVLALGAPVAPDAVEMYTKAVESGVKIIRYDREKTLAEDVILNGDYIVDCIFGIGFHGEPDELCSKIFSLINSSYAFVFSVDVPSGADTDTGMTGCVCVNASKTYAISTLKPAHLIYPAKKACCKVEVLDIGVSDEAYEAVNPVFTTIFGDELEEIIPIRADDSHKNDFGHVLCIAGSRKMPGAAVMCSTACTRAGAGLVTLAFPNSAYAAAASHASEIMLCPLPESDDGKLVFTDDLLLELHPEIGKADVIVMGCGLGQSSEITELVSHIIRNANGTLVLDADALNAVASNPSVLKESNASIIITPHPGEFARLLRTFPKDIFENRVKNAKSFAKEYGVTVLLKGASTIVASNETEQIYINNSGNPGLAKGGSGDVLSGIIGALCAQGLTPFDAACAGAFIHGRAAEFASENKGIASMTATDLYDGICEVYKEIHR